VTNLYGYVLNDPVNSLDLSGLQSSDGGTSTSPGRAIPGPMLDGITIYPNAPIVNIDMPACDPTTGEEIYCTKKTPEHQKCMIPPEGDPRDPTSFWKKVEIWITKILIGSGEKFETTSVSQGGGSRG
jgi:hypothetical protein